MQFDVTLITDLHVDATQTQGMFSKLLFDEYWTAGNESLRFTHKKSKHGFGLQLTEKEAKQVLKTLGV